MTNQPKEEEKYEKCPLGQRQAGVEVEEEDGKTGNSRPEYLARLSTGEQQQQFRSQGSSPAFNEEMSPSNFFVAIAN